LTHFPTCRKVWLSSARRPPFVKAGKEAHSIYGGWANMMEMKFWDSVEAYTEYMENEF